MGITLKKNSATTFFSKTTPQNDGYRFVISPQTDWWSYEYKTGIIKIIIVNTRERLNFSVFLNGRNQFACLLCYYIIFLSSRFFLSLFVFNFSLFSCLVRLKFIGKVTPESGRIHFSCNDVNTPHDIE